MRIEHKLPAAVAAYAQRVLQQLREIRTQYLAVLGQAKELELAAETVRQALSQQLALVEESERLPKPLAPYQLSADGTSLVGEIAELPRSTEAPAAVEGAQARVNGPEARYG